MNTYQIRSESLDRSRGEEDPLPIQLGVVQTSSRVKRTDFLSLQNAVEENPYHKDEEFLKISPRGLVPVRHVKRPPST